MEKKKNGRPKEKETKCHRHTLRLSDKEVLKVLKYQRTKGCTASSFSGVIREALNEKLA